MISNHPIQLAWRGLSVAVLSLSLSACFNLTVVHQTSENTPRAKAEAVTAEVRQALAPLIPVSMGSWLSRVPGSPVTGGAIGDFDVGVAAGSVHVVVALQAGKVARSGTATGWTISLPT